MIRRLLYPFLLLTALSAVSQVRVVKPAPPAKPKTTRIGVYGGVTNSVLLLERNIKEENSANGFNFGLTYRLNRLARVSAEYTRYRKIDIAPTWYDVRASTFEVNVHVIAKMRDADFYFYPLFGLSYNSFFGFFTGANDYLNLSQVYNRNENVKTNWLGLNMGTGGEYSIERIGLFGEFKMRIGKAGENRQLNILDVCFSAGMRYYLRVPTMHQLFRGTRSRYLLDSSPDEF
jgi:hypothetical protein